MATDSNYRNLNSPVPESDLVARFEHIRRRLREAHQAGRGVNLSAEEVQLLGVSMMAEWWNEDVEVLNRPLHRE